MGIKLGAEEIVELIKGYFQDNEFEPICLETGDTLEFKIKFICVEGVTFIIEELDVS